MDPESSTRGLVAFMGEYRLAQSFIDVAVKFIKSEWLLPSEQRAEWHIMIGASTQDMKIKNAKNRSGRPSTHTFRGTTISQIANRCLYVEIPTRDAMRKTARNTCRLEAMLVARFR